MFHALITPEDEAGGGSVELSGEAAPYDLQVLYDYVLQMRRRRGAVQVLLRVAAGSQPVIRARLAGLAREGIRLVFQE